MGGEGKNSKVRNGSGRSRMVGNGPQQVNSRSAPALIVRSCRDTRRGAAEDRGVVLAQLAWRINMARIIMHKQCQCYLLFMINHK